MKKKTVIIKLNKLLVISIITVLFLFAGEHNASAARIKDLTSISGIRTNQLLGYGVVVGLDGTGDKSGVQFTLQTLASMMERMGIHVDKNKINVKNVASVMVTASLPAFARIGSTLDVNIASMGDAKSLVGGSLIMTPLLGVDGNVYALTQGPIAIGGAGAGGGGGQTIKNHLLGGRIANGATVEREIPMRLNGKSRLVMSLFNPDFTTIKRVADTINVAVGKGTAQILDSAALQINIPEKMQNNVAKFIADIETLTVIPDMRAKIVVNEKTGTVVIGDNVTISTVAVTHGNLTITVTEGTDVVQPAPFAGGETVVTDKTDVEMTEEEVNVMLMPGNSTIGELVKALNAIGVTPRDMISIFQSIKAAGALQADLVII